MRWVALAFGLAWFLTTCVLVLVLAGRERALAQKVSFEKDWCTAMTAQLRQDLARCEARR